MGSSKYRLIQWNCRGIKPRYEELLLLLTLLRPSVFCLQETYLKPEDNFTFKTFNTYNHIHSDCLRASGGSSVLVNSSLPQREIKLKTDLQAVAVSISLEKEITLCSVYIPPFFSLRSEHLNSLLQQLPSPYMLLGDFNGHNVNWDLFHTLCDESLTTASLSNSTDRIADFTSSLIDISERCIPKTSTNPKKVTRGIMTTVKKLLNREKKLCLGSVNFQLKIT